MQKESLPFYRKSQPSGQEADALSKILAEIDPNANLYKKKELFHREKEIKRSMIAFFKALLLVFCLVLVASVVIEGSFNSELDTLNDEKITHINRLRELSYEYDSAKQIQRKIELYKTIKSQRRLIGTSIEKIFNNATPSLTLITFITDQQKFKISARGRAAVDVVQAIYKVLDSGVVSSLSLTSAEVRTSDGSFVVDMEGIYK